MTVLRILFATLVLPAAAVAAPLEIVAGPMLGHVGPREALVWLATSDDAILQVDVRPIGAEAWRTVSRPDGRPWHVRVYRDTAHTATLRISDLEPRTEYEYRVRDEAAGILPIDGPARFRTAPEPGTQTDLVVAFGSCASTTWGSDPTQPIFRAVAGAHPDLFLFLGDNVYFDRSTQEWSDPAAMWTRYRTGRTVPNLQPLLRTTPIYAIWDDHDYGSNDSDKLFPARDLSFHIFRSYWANPAYGSDGQPGVWFDVRWGDVHFFLLDARTYREPVSAPDGPHKTQWGPVQRRWLADALTASDATFKVVVNSTQLLSSWRQDETGIHYLDERRWLVDLVRSERIDGVLFLSGDRHLGEILRLDPPATPYPWWEVTSSPLAAGISSRPSRDDEVPERRPGSMILEENFGLLEFRFEPEPEVRIGFRSVTGEPIGLAVTIPARDLRVP